MNDDDLDEKFMQLAQYFTDHPDDPDRGEFDRFVRGVVLDPRYHQSLVERLKRDELAPAVLDMLLAYARDPRPTEGRTFARKVLSEAWRDEDAIH